MRLRSAIAILLITAACSGAPAATTSIAVTTKEFSFTPSSWTVQTAKVITVTLKNEGTAEHEWVIIKDKVQLATEADFTEDLVYFEVEAVPAGQTASGTFTAPATGTYMIMCALPGHFAGGMKGTLTIVP